MNFVAIDFETANAKRNSACSVGLAFVENWKIVKSFSSLIRPPEMRFDGINISIHGITEEDVEDQPQFPEIWAMIEPAINGNMVVAHNASFDMSVLRYSLDEYELPYPDFQHNCTMRAAKECMPEAGNHKLTTLADYFGIEFCHHEAESDAKACAELAFALCRHANVGNLFEIVPSRPFEKKNIPQPRVVRITPTKQTSQKLLVKGKVPEPLANSFDEFVKTNGLVKARTVAAAVRAFLLVSPEQQKQWYEAAYKPLPGKEAPGPVPVPSPNPKGS